LFSTAKILVVDDEELIREFFLAALSKREIEVDVCSDGGQAMEALESGRYDLVITDLRMPKVDGMELLSWIIGKHPDTPVIMLTAYASLDGAVEAMRVGAFDYLPKPITNLNLLDLTLYRALQYRSLLNENQQLMGKLSERYSFDRMVGPSPQMQEMFEVLSMVAPTSATVLVQGPSGTGKELVARAIHYNSPRSKKPYIRVNCAAIPENLIESVLFGHEKGSFTGAIKSTRGKFQAANGGTLLLDEIGEMPISLQAKLLRVLQEKEFEPVGSNESVKVDFRLIATTNVDLEKAIEAGDFREDLYYRLNVIPITIPPLNERREDISVLAFHFLRQQTIIHGRKIERISQSAMQHMLQAPWRGNVRELENSIERAVVMCKGEELELHDFFIGKLHPESDIAPVPVTQIVDMSQKSLAQVEKEHIIKTLQSQGDHRARTAEMLQISIRTLRNKLNEYKLHDKPK